MLLPDSPPSRADPSNDGSAELTGSFAAEGEVAAEARDVESDFGGLFFLALRILIGAGFLLFASLAFAYQFFFSSVVREGMVPLSSGSALLLLALWLYLRHRTKDWNALRRLLPAATTVLVSSALANLAVLLALTGDIGLTRSLNILLVAEGYFFLSPLWFLANVSLALASWGVVVGTFLPGEDFSPWLVSLCLAVMTGGLINGIRWASNKQIQEAAAREKRQAEALERAKLASDAANEAKSRFLANVSHEMRTPLVPIVSLSDLLLESRLAPRERRQVELVKLAGQRLLRQVDDLLELSRVEAGKIEVEDVEFRPAEVVAGAVDFHSEDASSKGLVLKIEIAPGLPTHLRGDPGRIGQVLSNLISNAIKFTPVGSVTVRARFEPAGDSSYLRFEVQDDGPGVPEESPSRLFGRFEQGDSSTPHTHGGTGLGLAIAKSLVDLMNGEIGIDSPTEGGALFWFTVAVKEERTAAAENRAATAAEEEQSDTLESVRTRPIVGGRILLAEDNAISQEVLSLLLARLGLAVDVASNGEEAVRLVQANSYRLVLMDCDMPKLDGVAATRQIRAGETGGRRVPIVALTAYASDDSRARCLANGMDDFLGKPFSEENLAATIERWILPPPTPEEKDAQASSAIEDRIYDRLRELERSSGKDFVDPMVQSFLDAAPAKLEEMCAAAAREDRESIGRIAHSMKSESGMLGAIKLSKWCSTLQDTASAAPKVELRETLERLRAELDRAAAEFVERSKGAIRWRPAPRGEA